MPYSTDKGKTWIETDFDRDIDYLKKNGWYFPQGEYCVKDHLRIEIDFFPCMVMNGNNYREWETLQELKSILEDESFMKA